MPKHGVEPRYFSLPPHSNPTRFNAIFIHKRRAYKQLINIVNGRVYQKVHEDRSSVLFTKKVHYPEVIEERYSVQRFFHKWMA